MLLGNAISDIQLWIICVISTNDGQDVVGGWRNDQEALKPREVQPALASVIQKSSLCVCQSHICSVSLFTVVCQRKIGNKKEREKEKTRKQTYQRQIRAKVDHVTDCVFLPAHVISWAGYTQFVRWSDWEWSMQKRLSRPDCPHYEWLPLRMLRSRGGNSLWGGSFHQRPRSTLLSHQIQRPLSEFGSPPRVSSPQRKGSTLRLSFSEEGDREDVDEFSQNVRLHKHVVNK